MKKTTDKTFDEEILQAEGAVVVDFYTTWCGPCKRLSPILEDLSGELTDITFVKHDAEDSLVADKLNIRSVPTLILFNNGQEVSRKEGLQSKPALRDWIQESTS